MSLETKVVQSKCQNFMVGKCTYNKKKTSAEIISLKSSQEIKFDKLFKK